MINITNLYKNFGDLEVLKNISTEIKKGEIISIIGPSGSGKSTFLRCINKLEEPSSGHIYIDGMDLMDKNTDINKVRERVGMVFQHFNLFPNMTVLDNLTLSPIMVKKESKEEAEKYALSLLEKVGLSDKANSYPTQLSGGQKQRIAIARALAMKPEVILFDEPTSALDPEMIKEVLDVMRDLAKEGMTMLIVTHEMGFARNVGNRILFMDKGEIISIIGPSGSGKSTFLRCINKLEEPSSGHIYIDGMDLMDKNTDINKVRERVGMVFQHFNLFPNMTVLDNLTLSPIMVKKESKEEAEKYALSLLEKVGLSDKANSYPTQLSGGQKQRIAIARALAMKPEVILFDEPTSALDPEMIKEVLDVMRDLAKEGMTMLIVTHEMGFARNVGNRILFMDKGEIIEDCSPKEFFENPTNERIKDFLNKVLNK